MSNLEITGFHFRVQVLFKITIEELEHMIRCSEMHYDYKCKAASQRGGFLYGWRNMLTHYNEDGKPEGYEPFVEVQSSFREMDTLCKILEQESSLDSLDRLAVRHGEEPRGGPRLHGRVYDMLKAMREQSDRVNEEE